MLFVTALIFTLRENACLRAEIVTKSRLALTDIQRTRRWALPIITDMKLHRLTLLHRRVM
jgi:hypothetical protein